MKERQNHTPANGIAKVNTLAELGSEFAPVASSANLSWRGFSLEHYRLPDNSASGKKCFNCHILAVLHKGSFKETVGAKGWRSPVVHCPGDLVFYPAHFSSSASDATGVNQTILYLEPFFVEGIARDLIVGERIEITPQPKFNDDFVKDAAKHLLAEVESGGATGTLYAESLMIALAARMIKNYSTARILSHEYKGGLAKHKLRLTVEFINEHLSEKLSLSALAALCDLSQFHFAKAFKLSTGLTPHNYVTQQRIERAKRMLAGTDKTIAEIAFSLGFADQSHFTKTFRRLNGVSPMFYRQQI